jgi:hypothetical protein
MTSYFPIFDTTAGNPGTVVAREKSMRHHTITSRPGTRCALPGVTPVTHPQRQRRAFIAPRART